MHRTRKLCAIMIDTVGRELLIHSEAKLDEQGWPRHSRKLSVKTGDKASHVQREYQMQFSVALTWNLNMPHHIHLMNLSCSHHRRTDSKAKKELCNSQTFRR